MKNKLVYAAVLTLIIIIIGIRLTEKTKGIHIGFIAPLSGQYASLGENYEKGVELAREEYNATHSSNPISLYAEDDAFNAEKGNSAYQKLISIDHIDALLNLSTPTIEAIYPTAITTHMPVLQWGIQVRPAAEDNIFQITPDGSRAIQIYTNYISSRKHYSNIAVVYENGPAQISFFEAFKSVYPNPYIGYKTESTSDFRTFISKILVKKPDAILIMMNGEDGALFTKELLTQEKYKPDLLYDAQLQSGWADYQRILGDTKSIDGALSMWTKTASSTFATKFKDKYGTDPGFGADYGYDSFNVLAHAYNTDPITWQKNIEDTKTEGATGGITFDAKGVRKQDIIVDTISNGKVTLFDDAIPQD